MTATIYVLRPDRISNDMVKCAYEIHREAKRGNITGMAFVCYLSDGGFIANAAGDAFLNRALTRGMVLDLLDKLGHLPSGATAV